MPSLASATICRRPHRMETALGQKLLQKSVQDALLGPLLDHIYKPKVNGPMNVHVHATLEDGAPLDATVHFELVIEPEPEPEPSPSPPPSPSPSPSLGPTRRQHSRTSARMACPWTSTS